MPMRYLLAALLIGGGIALQFVPLFERRLAPLVARHPALAVLRSRLLQLGLGFALLYAGISLVRTP